MKRTIRVIETASKWGNLYNFRYFIDGTRVSRVDYLRILDNYKSMRIGVSHTSYGFRTLFLITK